MTKLKFLNYFQMLTYSGPIPSSYKAFTLIMLVLGCSAGSIDFETVLVQDKKSMWYSISWMVCSFLAYTLAYIALYKILKDRFFEYFFRMYVSVQVLVLVLMTVFTFATIIKGNVGILHGVETGESAKGLADAMGIFAIALELVLMFIPLKWAKETVS